jgi:uncharacterized protein
VHTLYRPLRLNVGFLLSQAAGYGRQFDFREPKLTLGGDIQVEEFTGRVLLNRTPQGIVAQGDFSAQIPAECARCLRPFTAPVTIHLEDLFVYPPQNATDPLLSVGEDAHLNLEPLLREYALINQPTRLLCRADCKGLCATCGNDLNEGECIHPEEAPRGLIPERLLIQTSSKSETLPISTVDPEGAKPQSPKTPARKESVSGGKEKPRKKKSASTASRKKETGGKKASAGKKTTAGGKKKQIKKK